MEKGGWGHVEWPWHVKNGTGHDPGHVGRLLARRGALGFLGDGGLFGWGFLGRYRDAHGT